MTSVSKVVAKIPSGVGILTTKNQAMLASWFQQVSFEPLQIGVSVRSTREILTEIESMGFFGLNLFDEQERKLFGYFSKGFEPGQDPFTGILLSRTAQEIPVLTESMAFIECSFVKKIDVGDHQLVIGEVIGSDIFKEEARPYVHLRKDALKY